eukprot:1361206-Amorphochlora_amoeboformis.AAC.2
MDWRAYEDQARTLLRKEEFSDAAVAAGRAIEAYSRETREQKKGAHPDAKAMARLIATRGKGYDLSLNSGSILEKLKKREYLA